MRLFLIFLTLVVLFASCKEEKKMTAEDYFNAGLEAYNKGDRDAALKYFKKGCELKDSQSCRNVGAIYIDIGEEKRNEEFIKEALVYLDKSCKFGDTDICGKLARVYYHGEELKSYKIRPDINKTLDYYEIACNFKDSKSCYAVGNILASVFGKEKQALKYFNKSCKLGYGDGCKAFRFYSGF